MNISFMEGDCLASMRGMADQSVNCCVTSPPYFGLRDYGRAGQIGLEQTPDAYVAKLVDVFREVKRVLRDDGTLWLNLGDSYAGYWGDAKAKAEGRASSADSNGWTNGFSMNSRPKFHDAFGGSGIKPKDLIGIPWRVAFALQAEGWYLRQDIIWHKPNPMPESVRDRCTKAHEYIFLLSKSERYYYDAEAIAEPAQNWGTRDRSNFRGGTKDPMLKQHGLAGKEFEEEPTRNKRSVWTVTTKPFKGAHFATFPPDLIEPCILAGSKLGDVVLDPFGGAGTTGLVASRLGRNAILCELNSEYVSLARERIQADKKKQLEQLA